MYNQYFMIVMIQIQSIGHFIIIYQKDVIMENLVNKQLDGIVIVELKIQLLLIQHMMVIVDLK